jgi:hypothetical protein
LAYYFAFLWRDRVKPPKPSEAIYIALKYKSFPVSHNSYFIKIGEGVGERGEKRNI